MPAVATASTTATTRLCTSRRTGRGAVEGLGAGERYRLRQRLARLRDSEDKALVVRSLLARRTERVEYEAFDAAAVESDARAMRSGLSDERSGLTRSNEAEVYVLSSQARAVAVSGSRSRRAG